MIVYYTGTGNSRYVAQRFAAALGDDLITEYLDRIVEVLEDDALFHSVMYFFLTGRHFFHASAVGSFSQKVVP